MEMEQGPVKAVDFDERFAMLQFYNINSSRLIEDLINYCKRRDAAFAVEESRLRTELHNAELDLKHATKSRRDLQEELRERDGTIEELRKSHDILKNSNPYVAVLIDGDGLLFKEEFIRQGVEGGKRAASALRAAIASLAENIIRDLPSNIEVVATVYANLNGLTGAMRRAGWVDGADVLKEFTLGFTQTKASFDFIDVGYGKERADSKLRGATSWHLKNSNCKLLALGVSHDSGYAPFLDEIVNFGQTRDRIVLLEGSPTVAELVATKVRIHKLTDTVFHDEKLVAIERLPAMQKTTSGSMSGSTNSAPIASAKAMANSRRDSSSSAGASATVSMATSTSALSYATTAKTTSTRVSPPPKMVFPTATAKQLQQKETAATKKTTEKWNPGPRGLDPPIAFKPSVVEAIRSRSEKFCNKFVLLKWCPNDNCPYNHNQKVTPDEMAALRYMNRANPCSSGQNCELEDCIYGHHCPSVQNGCCTHPYCKFEVDEHPPNTKFRYNYNRD